MYIALTMNKKIVKEEYKQEPQLWIRNVEIDSFLDLPLVSE